MRVIIRRTVSMHNQPLNNIIEDRRTRSEMINIALAVEYNNLVSEKYKLEGELEIYHDRLRRLTSEASEQAEIISRLESIIMNFAHCLPVDEQLKLSHAVYVAKQFVPDRYNQTFDKQDNNCDTISKSIESSDLANPDTSSNNQPYVSNSQQQALVDMISWIQSLASQVNTGCFNSQNTDGDPKAEQKKPTTRRRTPAIKKISKNTLQQNLATGAQSQPHASEAQASQNLKQTSMYDFFKKSF